MKAENRFKLVLDIRYGDGSGGVVYSFHYDPEGVILSFLTSLQDPDKEYATTGSWYNFYEIIDLKKKKYVMHIKEQRVELKMDELKKLNLLKLGRFLSIF